MKAKRLSTDTLEELRRDVEAVEGDCDCENTGTRLCRLCVIMSIVDRSDIYEGMRMLVDEVTRLRSLFMDTVNSFDDTKKLIEIVAEAIGKDAASEGVKNVVGAAARKLMESYSDKCDPTKYEFKVGQKLSHSYNPWEGIIERVQDNAVHVHWTNIINDHRECRLTYSPAQLLEVAYLVEESI